MFKAKSIGIPFKTPKLLSPFIKSRAVMFQRLLGAGEGAGITGIVTLFADNFGACNLANWTVLAGTWSCNAFQLLLSGTAAVPYIQSNLGVAWTNYTLTTDAVVCGAWEWQKHFVRFVDVNNNYALSLNCASAVPNLFTTGGVSKIVGGVLTWLDALGPLSVNYALPCTVVMQVQDEGANTRIKVWINGTLEFNVLDAPTSIVAGRVGYGADAWNGCRFDNVTVVG